MAKARTFTSILGRKLVASYDNAGRDISASIDRIPGRYISGATVDGDHLVLTEVDQSGKTPSTSTVEFTGGGNVRADWDEDDPESEAYIVNRPDIIIPLASPAAQGGYAAPRNLVVVDTMPAYADIDPYTVYLVREST